MSEQEQERDLTPTMQAMMAEMAAMRTELNSLKQRTNVVIPPEPIQKVGPVVTTTRRKTLKRLGLALLGGAAAATAVGIPEAQARVMANPTTNGLTNMAGMLVLPPGATAPGGTLPTSFYTYGLIASGDKTTPFNVSTLPQINTGVYGTSSSGNGVYGSSPSSNGVLGTSPSGNGVFGTSTNGVGIYGNSSSGYSGYFSGKVYIGGPLSKPSGSFKIDHPLDPENKYLYHSFVESPDMMNIYNGIVTLDEQGEATIEMPDWFDALNSDFRYQLTALDSASPNLHIAQRLKDRKFKIAGGLPGQQVSWMVTGIRQDQWAKTHRIQVEEDKKDNEKGKYLHPELFGQPEEMSVHPRADRGVK